MLDLTCGIGAALGEFADLLGDDRKAATRLAGARAASTPAFSARRFVWKAISSMTPMILAISSEDFSIAPMASTARATTSSETRASFKAEPTTSEASGRHRLLT